MMEWVKFDHDKEQSVRSTQIASHVSFQEEKRHTKKRQPTETLFWEKENNQKIPHTTILEKSTKTQEGHPKDEYLSFLFRHENQEAKPTKDKKSKIKINGANQQHQQNTLGIRKRKREEPNTRRRWIEHRLAKGCHSVAAINQQSFKWGNQNEQNLGSTEGENWGNETLALFFSLFFLEA